jgi:UDP-2-acetamido-2-deoxy-ribo-hexuluronate aminotransferase
MLAEFCEGKCWLAALSGEADVFGAQNLEHGQLVRALRRFDPQGIRLLTRDGDLLEKCELAMTPEAFLALDTGKAGLDFIDLKAQQDILRPALEENIHRVLGHGRYILGPEIEKLEGELAAYVGTEHAITCSSGTDALMMALMALGVGPGDEVITVPYTWISSAEVVSLLNARPVFVDIQPDTMNLDPALLEAAISPATRAILPVGIYGQCPDMTAINGIAEKHGLPVVEDGAQSFGATHGGRKSCALSLVGCTSFYPSKPLGCYGDGGAIFTDDAVLAERMRQIRVHGEALKRRHPRLGINGRFDSLQAAVLLAKLAVFPEECRLRREVARRYDDLLAEVPGVQVPFIARGNESVYAQYTLLTEERDALAAALKTDQVPSAAYYTAPLHLQGAFAGLGHKRGDFPVAENVARRCLSLPLSPYLGIDDQKRIAAAIKRFFARTTG